MMQPLYIISASTISPQHTYDAGSFLEPVVSSDNGKLFVVDPDYSRYIGPVPIRRMSRLLKRGITAGMRALEDAAITTPDAIIIGTAHGSIIDMEVFTKDMINLKEEALNPTSFIQSTYNSVNGWLAMLCKCTAYNQTYVHRGFSLEMSLIDAQLMLAESAAPKYLLTGCLDELTEDYITIRTKIGYFKDQLSNSSDLLNHSDTPGSIGGEGAHFFTLSNEAGKSACAIHSVQMLHQPGAGEVEDATTQMLTDYELDLNDIDVVVCGMNGDNRTSFLTAPLIASASPRTTIATFKHLSGEYPTASGFGLWLADYLFRQQTVPPAVVYKQGTNNAIKNLLFCNVTIAGNVSLMLLKSAV
jgi:3-oxoacyl-[acyl-carrier-protein] synthase II